MPRFNRGAQFQLNPPLDEFANSREAKLEVRCEPSRIKREAGLVQLAQEILKILLHEVR
jgi:hypothetical protein